MARGVEIGRGFIAVDVDSSAAHAALSKFGSLAASAFKVAAAGAAVVGAAVVKMAFSFNALKEQSLIAFETLLGSGAKAQAMFSSLQKFAAATPFELPGLVDNARQLLGVGVAANKVIPTLTALGNTAGALGIDQERFNRILLAVTQSMGKGKLQGEELMQMVENGIPVWQLLSKALGKTVPELQKMSSQGKLIAQDVLPKLFDQMQKDYGGAMAKQATTLAGVWSSLKDNAKILSGTALTPLFNVVKDGVGALGNLAASDGAAKWAQHFADASVSATKRAGAFIDLLRDRYGGEANVIFSKAAEAAGKLWDTFKTEGVPIIKQMANLFVTLLPPLAQLAQSMGGLLKPALEAVKTVLTAVGDNAGNFANLIRTAAEVVSSVAGPAIKIFGEGLKIAANLLGILADLIGNLSGPLGVMAGVVVSTVVAWRLLAPVIAGVGAAISAIKPATVADALGSFSKKFQDVSLSAGVMTEKLTGSANAGEKVAVAGSKIGTTLSKVASALPLIGIAVLGIGLLFEAGAQHAEELNKQAIEMGHSLDVGGSKGAEAGRKLRELEDAVRANESSLNDFDKAMADAHGDSEVFADNTYKASKSLDENKKQLETARKAAADYADELGPVGLAQARVSQAQTDYNKAIKDFGYGSSEAIIAQGALVEETHKLERAQIDAARAAKDQNQSLYDLTTTALAASNADLQLRQSQQGVRKAMDDLNNVQKDGKATAEDRRAAELNLESQMLRTAEAARQKALADTNGKSASERAQAAEKAYASEILNMAAAAGSNAPEALRNLIGHLDAASIKAAGASVKVNDLNQAVVTMPDGRTITISAENSQALREIADVQARLADAQRRAQLTITARLAGGLPAISDQKVRARGGSISPGDGPILVGEEGPEYVYADRAGYVADHQASMQIGNGPARGGIGSAGDVFNIYDQSDPYSTAMNVQRVQQFTRRLR